MADPGERRQKGGLVMHRLLTTAVLGFTLLAATRTSGAEPQSSVPRGAVPSPAAEPGRPAALPLLYATLGAAQVFDVYSTNAALKAGARETNPLMRPFAGRTGAALAVKAASTATTILLVERMWKRHPIRAIVTLAVASGVTTAVAARNLRHARVR